jgi:hypothetical protein
MRSAFRMLLSGLLLGAGMLVTVGRPAACEPVATAASNPTPAAAVPATATADPSTAAPQAVAAAPILFDAGEPQSCGASPQLPLSNLPPGAVPATFPTCGTCSDVWCRGARYNSTCFTGTYGVCIDPYGNDYCSDGRSKCQCWHGPIP